MPPTMTVGVRLTYRSASPDSSVGFAAEPRWRVVRRPPTAPGR